MTHVKEDILGLMPNEIIKELADMGEQPFRGKQVVNWLYKGINSFGAMTNLPKSTRQKLESKYKIGSLKQIDRQKSEKGDTIKYLYLLADNNIIECVVMKYAYGNTLCLSTQVGCRMGCSFCASTKEGLVRNLEVGEMVAQLLIANSDIGRAEDRGIRNIVLMGVVNH